MKELFCSYEQSLALKELGMDLGWDNYIEFYDTSTKDFCDVMKEVPAPLYQQAFRWFRDEYNLIYNIDHSLRYAWSYKIYVIDFDWVNEFKTYEKAELACLKKLIEIVKGGQDA